MNYCYARVSTIEQHLDRQITAFKPYEPYVLFQDKESGKDFNRVNYQKMKRKLKNGDTLIVLSLDRFGRNYDQIKEEWQQLSKKGVKIKIIDMPIIDTTTNDLTSKLISDIVIQLLSYVAQTERENIHKRQAEGIKSAKERGVKFGRPRVEIPEDFDYIARQYVNGYITNVEASETLGLARATFFRYLKERGFCIKGRKWSKRYIYKVNYCNKNTTLGFEDLLEELDIDEETLENYFKGEHTIINDMGIKIERIKEAIGNDR